MQTLTVLGGVILSGGNLANLLFYVPGLIKSHDMTNLKNALKAQQNNAGSVGAISGNFIEEDGLFISEDNGDVVISVSNGDGREFDDDDVNDLSNEFQDQGNVDIRSITVNEYTSNGMAGYTTSEGDTLRSISARHGMSVDQLVAVNHSLNGASDPNAAIDPNQSLSVYQLEKSTTYTVETGTDGRDVAKITGPSENEQIIQMTYSGDDLLHSSDGDDFLMGGQGDDRYLFDADGFGHDIIQDEDGGKLMIGGKLFAGMASHKGENKYSLNDMDLSVESADGVQNLKISSAGGDSVTIQDWKRGDFGITLGTVNVDTPESDFQDWASDNGMTDFGALNIDGSLDIEKMAIDMDVDMGQLVSLPQTCVNIADMGVNLGIDLSGMAMNVVNTFVQELIDGIIDSLVSAVTKIVISGIVKVVMSIVIPIIGPALASASMAEMVAQVGGLIDNVMKVYEKMDEIYGKLKKYEGKIREMFGSLESILNPVDNTDHVWITKEPPEGTSFHEVDTGDGDDIIYTSNIKDVINAGADNDYVVSMGGDDIIDLGSGDNYAQAGAGDDSVIGGSGDDIAV